MKRRNYCPPRVLTLKYAATCAETGRRLPAGSTAWYVYSTSKAYAVDSTTAAKLAAQQDRGGDRFDMLYEDACARACGL
jgi:hypothetical protein